jgi:ribosome-binding factor A
MPREFSRLDRVADQLQRELARLIQREVKDPRLGMVTINSIDVSKDLAVADVYVTVMGKESADEVKPSIEALNHAAGFLRNQIAKTMMLRTVPKLRFHYDASVVRGHYLSNLIDKAIAEDKQHEGNKDSE